jgi:hypothetical protein
VAAVRPFAQKGDRAEGRGGRPASGFSFGSLPVVPARGEEPSVLDLAARGVEAPGTRLPHADRIQASFGHHDITGVRAHLGPQAADASGRMGAEAYTAGDHVVFARAPSLRTAAHEAAHVVQQRAGVQLSGGVGAAGDPYERHADAVASLVAAGRPAAPLLDRMAGPAPSQHAAGGTQRAVQREEANPPPQKSAAPLAHPDPQWFADFLATNPIRWSIANAIAHAYVAHNQPAPPVQSGSGGYKWDPGQVTAPSGSVPAVTTYSGGLPGYTAPADLPPTEAEVASAVYGAIDLKKTGKGDKVTDWTWTWKDEPDKPKTTGEKATEVTKFAVGQAADKARDEAGKGAVKALEKGGKATAARWVKGGFEALDISADFVEKKGVSVALKLVGVAEESLAGPIGWLLLALDIGELLISLGEPSKERSRADKIIDDVKAYLKGEQEAAEMRERLSKGMRFSTTPAVSDATRVAR